MWPVGEKLPESHNRRSRGPLVPAPALTGAKALTAQEQAWRKEMLANLHSEGAALDFIYAFEKTGNLITAENRREWSRAELEEWNQLLRAYERKIVFESRIIDLAFLLPRGARHAELGKQKETAASEFTMAVWSAHEQGMSSFAVEQVFREVWLDMALKRSHAPDTEWNPTDHHRFDDVDLSPIRRLIEQLCGEEPRSGAGEGITAEEEKRIAKIVDARATDDAWFGKAPAPGQQDESHLDVFMEDVYHAIRKSEDAGVPLDVIESMLLRSWIRFLFFNERRDERSFHILDQQWDVLYAQVQLQMSRCSRVRVQ